MLSVHPSETTVRYTKSMGLKIKHKSSLELIDASNMRRSKERWREGKWLG